LIKTLLSLYLTDKKGSDYLYLVAIVIGAMDHYQIFAERPMIIGMWIASTPEFLTGTAEEKSKQAHTPGKPTD
jgi:hypothetical protein